MVRKLSAWSAWICGVTLAASASIVLMGLTAHAQTGWEDDASPDAVRAKKVPPPPPPPPLQIAGSWAGNLLDNEQGPGTVAFVFTEKAINKKKARIKGTWSVTFPHTAPSGGFTDVGTVAGTVTGAVLAITMHPKRGDRATCNLAFKSESATEEQIGGTFGFVLAACGGSKRKTGPMSFAPVP